MLPNSVLGISSAFEFIVKIVKPVFSSLYKVLSYEPKKSTFIFVSSLKSSPTTLILYMSEIGLVAIFTYK